MKTSQEETPYGPVITVEVPNPQKVVMMLGGWEQNPEYMKAAQEVLAASRISSVGISAFDTIDPMSDLSMKEALGYETDDPLLAEVSTRMLHRAHILNNMSSYVLNKSLEPGSVLTHCAGANVFLLAHYLQALEGESGYLPRDGVLSEPMLAEQITTRDYYTSFARHERKARNDASYISLRTLSPPSSEGFQAERARRPLEDIVTSRGITLFIRALESGLDLRIMLGDDTDYAANQSRISQELLGKYHDSIHRYSNQQRHGHGYLLDSPRHALQDIVPLLLADEVVQASNR